ncbi:hypothetical protein [Actinacidiphila oryziradicis]|uniref:Uncharacterized protein n=1 Tax=Actinacidiphila oryziradicis TaxID=2571141 RepID=A0A4V5MY00_9ACTN|nr:hypothetical protein [Actinacidiphila oryziradicis]TJZ97108.1 hypothetical protein FCI23_50020 [Actinacidiphila oryziradicis]
MGLTNDIETQSMLFEAAVPVTSVIVAALGQRDLSWPARWRLIYLLLILVSGESAQSEVDGGRPDLEVECQDAARPGIPLLYQELERESVSGCSDLALEILESLGEDPGQLIVARGGGGRR